MAKGEKWKKLLEHLKGFAPTLAGAVGTVAGSPVLGAALASVAQALVKGTADPDDLDDVAATILGSPELRLEMERLAVEREKAHLELEAARMAAETERIKAVNATMQAEAGADDPWTRRWRPFFGFVTAAVWGILGLSYALSVVLVACGEAEPQVMATIGDAFAGMAVFWGVPLAVTGVSAWTRGQEKITRAKTATLKPGSLAVE